MEHLRETQDAVGWGANDGLLVEVDMMLFAEYLLGWI